MYTCWKSRCAILNKSGTWYPIWKGVSYQTIHYKKHHYNTSKCTTTRTDHTLSHFVVSNHTHSDKSKGLWSNKQWQLQERYFEASFHLQWQVKSVLTDQRVGSPLSHWQALMFTISCPLIFMRDPTESQALRYAVKVSDRAEENGNITRAGRCSWWSSWNETRNKYSSFSDCVDHSFIHLQKPLNPSHGHWKSGD